MSDEQTEIVSDLATEVGFDMRPYEVALKLKEALVHVADGGTEIDSGSGDGFADLWITLDGREYRLAISPSAAQSRKEKMN